MRKPDLITLLQQEFGTERILVDEDTLAPYGVDESGEGPYLPQAALLAQNALEVELLLTLAVHYAFPVTPRGLGTGKSGGALPVTGGVLLSLENMDRVLEVDTNSALAIVEPGVITQTLQETVWEQGLFYPPDPASLDTCSIGGNVAENAGGPRAFRYGVTREYVLGLEVVTMGGDRFHTGHKSIKGVSGYDLTGLLTGSEGTLGVFTKLLMRLIPSHRPSGLLLAFYKDFQAAGQGLTDLLLASVFPMSLELIDGYSLQHIAGVKGFAPPPGAGGAVLCELEGLPEDPALLRRAREVLKKSAPLHLEEALSQESMDTVWAARRNVSTRLKEHHAHKISEDIAVPRGAIPMALKMVQEISTRFGLKMGCYGHAGDGNLHVNLLSDTPPEGRFEAAVQELFVQTIRLGGTLTGEHGVGTTKRPYMPLEHAPGALQIMGAVKRAWDPYNLLNPGKIL